MKPFYRMLTTLLTAFAFESLAQAAWTGCATENAYCAFTETRSVRYGADTRWAYKTLTGGANCTNTVFGDPAVGTVKSCQYDSVSLPDLQVISFSQSPISPAAGQAVTFSATIKNNGSAAIPSGTNIGVSFMIDGVGVTWGATSTTLLAAGSSLTLTAKGGSNGATWAATAGVHTQFMVSGL